jgi:peptidoglycan/LPS O-acetylase OafA/YrhL
MPTDKRNHLIDLLRIFAAVGVVLFHFTHSATNTNNWYYKFCKYGYLGVPVFFMISGYCILIALQNAKKPSEFIIRRFFRIFPPYWFSLFLCCATVLIVTLITGANSVVVFPKSIAGFAATISLLTKPVTNIPTINWVYWTLSFEVFFYIAVYICSFFKRQYFTIALLVITLLSIVLPAYKSGALFFLGYWPIFSLGLSVYQLLHYPTAQKWLSVILLIFSVAGFYTTHQELVYVVVCFITVLLMVANHFKPLKDNFLSRLGDVSYSLYLIHVPIGIWLFDMFRTPVIRENLAYYILFDFALLALLIALSKLMHKYIEVLAIKYGKRFGR